MSLIPISPLACVNPIYVSSVVCKYEAKIVCVRMYDGAEHSIQPLHEEDVFAAYDRVRKELGCEEKP